MVRSIVRLYNNNDDDDGFYNFSRFPISVLQAKKKKLLSSTKQLYLFIYFQAAVPQATTHKIRTSVQHDVQFLQDLMK
ncbi:hypothetical protein T05_12992 [Trichinella murrelli]|uniref:Uncharacterized protein n=1 Tax=Trichinella murrelli TaxID=144512 RepID=A0A0V0TWD9_9BILA|nr:hypothetical protein T05_12992 [Trichinella murrelli]